MFKRNIHLLFFKIIFISFLLQNKIVYSLKQITEQLRKVVELNHKKDKLFNSWPTKNFGN